MGDRKSPDLGNTKGKEYEQQRPFNNGRGTGSISFWNESHE